MLMPRISVIAPVRTRPGSDGLGVLHNMLNSLNAMASLPSAVEVILRCDVDDGEMIEYLRQSGLTFIVGPRRDGYASLAAHINEAARLAAAELIIVVNDDAEFKTFGWDTRLVYEATRYPDGLFVFGVDTLNAKNFPFPCTSKAVIRALGFFYDERLIYTDIWLRDVACRFRRAVRVKNVRVEHNWRGMSEDQAKAVTEKVNAPGYQELYARCVDEGVARIRAAWRLK